MTNYKVTISPTANGQDDYLQIISDDGFETNIVLIGKFEVADSRKGNHTPAVIPGGKKKAKKSKRAKR